MNKYLMIFCLALFSCSPKVSIELTEIKRESRSELSHLAFAFIEKDTIHFESFELLGKIEIKDSGFTNQCDYQTIKSLAKHKSLSIGGNCLVITEHKVPGQTSTCHRIKADVYYIDQPEKFEFEIEWNEKRKLVIDDFKGIVPKGSFNASTATSFRTLLTTKNGYTQNYTIKATTIFDCKNSYFLRTSNDSINLAHEQIHFDITELYARKFLRRMENEAKTTNEAMSKQQNILDDIFIELKFKQEEYYSEVNSDPTKQLKWNNWIKGELKKTDAYKSKVLKVKDGIGNL